MNKSLTFADGNSKTSALAKIRESSFNMTRGEVKILRGAPKIFRHPKGGSETIVGLGGGALKICLLQNQHMASSYRSDNFELDSLVTCATKLYHMVYRYNKCSLSNYYTLFHPLLKTSKIRNAQPFFIIKPHCFNKISKSANGNYKNDYSVTINFIVWFLLDVRLIVQT